MELVLKRRYKKGETRRCKNCDQLAKVKIVKGVNKGYNDTCGGEACLPARRTTAQRKCKHCSNPVRKNLSSGRDKGYYRTCGGKECLKASYADANVNKSKGIMIKDDFRLCFICGSEYRKKTSAQNKYCTSCVPSAKWQRVAKIYGIGKQGFDTLFEIQKGKCALCDKAASCIDHDHITGKVRGLLCHGCNHIIIAIERGDDWISRAKNYLTNQHDCITLKIKSYAKAI